MPPLGILREGLKAFSNGRDLSEKWRDRATSHLPSGKLTEREIIIPNGNTRKNWPFFNSYVSHEGILNFWTFETS